MYVICFTFSCNGIQVWLDVVATRPRPLWALEPAKYYVYH